MAVFLQTKYLACEDHEEQLDRIHRNSDCTLRLVDVDASTDSSVLPSLVGVFDLNMMFDEPLLSRLVQLATKEQLTLR